MKMFILLLLSISALFAGGDILPVKEYQIPEYIEIEAPNPIYSSDKPQFLAIDYSHSKCQDCGEPAQLLPYHGEDIPLAETFPCPQEEIQGCPHHIA